MRLRLLREGGDIAAYFEYQRSRVRVARSTALNALVAAPVSVFFLLRRTDAEVAAALGVGAALLIMAALSEVACRRIEVAYLTRLSRAYRSSESTGSPLRPDRAAALPYRRTSHGVEFLVVRTTGKQRRWTFPKGHFEADEDAMLAAAAAREAREEAGVEGRVDEEQLATYLYPSAGGGDPLTVAAFLLDVTRDGLKRKGKDRGRELAW